MLGGAALPPTASHRSLHRPAPYLPNPPPLPPPTPCQFLTMAGFPGGVCRAFQVLRVHSLQHVVSVYYCGTAYIRRALGCVEYGNSGDNPGPGSV